MTKIIIILAIGLFSRAAAVSQGIVNFDLNFDANTPLQTYNFLVQLVPLATNSFDVNFDLGATPPVAGFIEQLDGETFTQVFQFTYQSIDVNGSTGITYGYAGSWQLTSDEIQNLMAGLWYAEVTYNDASYIGQITPVPEPLIIALLSAGLVLMFLHLYRQVVRYNTTLKLLY